MTHEKYARPGIYLDTDDHHQLIDENPSYRREHLERELHDINVALSLDQVTGETAARLEEKAEQLRTELGQYR